MKIYNIISVIDLSRIQNAYSSRHVDPNNQHNQYRRTISKLILNGS